MTLSKIAFELDKELGYLSLMLANCEIGDDERKSLDKLLLLINAKLQKNI